MKWRTKLLKFKRMPVVEQQINKQEILACWQEMWFSEPTIDDFAKYTSGLVLFPEMVYIMVKK
jgi:hypothetical protein